MFVLPRYAEVRDALENWQVFSSAGGVTMNDEMNEKLRGGLLCSDPPTHDVLRKVIERPLTPKAVSTLRERVTAEAERLVERLVGKGTFDVATELAPHLPVSIVSELVGLPEEGRERMLDWAPANFDCFGPINERTNAAFPIVGEMVNYAFTQCVPGKLKPGGWAQMIWDAAEKGEIDPAICPFLMNDYMGPSLDTTIFATISTIWLFARHPEEWEIVRRNPALLPPAINEAIRIESPIQAFSRYVAQDHEIDGVPLPRGSRAIVLFGSANRDERKWGDPENFRVMRNATNEHLGFGFGEHQCVGNNLARMEIRALLAALAKRVTRFELHEMERGVNNVLRGIRKCVVSVH
jgi:cytochrome P450